MKKSVILKVYCMRNFERDVKEAGRFCQPMRALIQVQNMHNEIQVAYELPQLAPPFPSFSAP